MKKQLCSHLGNRQIPQFIKDYQQKPRYKKIYKLLVIIISFQVLPYISADSLHAVNKMAVGIGYPYLVVNYQLSQQVTQEIRYAFEEGIRVVSLRLYNKKALGMYGFTDKGTLKVFFGAELGYISFEAIGIKGIGYEGSVFLGGEYYTSNHTSITLDIAPTYITLKDNEFDLTVGGIEWVTSIILYYHF